MTSIVETIKANGGNISVNTLTYNHKLCKEYGSAVEVINALIALASKGVIVAYDDGRRVKLA